MAIDKIDFIQSLIQETDNDSQKEIYLKLKVFLGYINYHYSSKIIDTELSKRFEELDAKFIMAEKFKLYFEKKGYVINYDPLAQ